MLESCSIYLTNKSKIVLYLSISNAKCPMPMHCAHKWNEMNEYSSSELKQITGDWLTRACTTIELNVSIICHTIWPGSCVYRRLILLSLLFFHLFLLFIYMILSYDTNANANAKTIRYDTKRHDAMRYNVMWLDPYKLHWYDRCHFDL